LKYYLEIKAKKENNYPFKNAPRGFPATLYKNAIRDGLTLDENTKTYKTNTHKGKAPPKARGRPKKPVAEKVAVVAPTPVAIAKPVPQQEKSIPKPESPKGKKEESDNEEEMFDLPDLEPDVNESEEEEEERPKTPPPKLDKELEDKVKKAKKSFDDNTDFHYRRMLETEYSYGDDEIEKEIKSLRGIDAQQERWDRELKEAEDQLPETIRAIRENPDNKFDDKGRWIVSGEQKNKYGNSPTIKLAVDLDTGIIKNNSPELGKGVKENMRNFGSGKKYQYGSNVAGLGGRSGLYVGDIPKGFERRVFPHDHIGFPSSYTLYRSKWGELQRQIWLSKYRKMEAGFYIPILEKMLRDRQEEREKEAEEYKQERDKEWEEFEKKLRSGGKGLSKYLVRMKGGASMTQKGRSAEARTFTKDSLRIFLNNVVHSGDLHPEASNPIPDPTNTYDSDLEDEIRLGQAVESYSKDIMKLPNVLKVPPEIEPELLDAPYKKLKANQKREQDILDDVAHYSHLIMTSLFDDYERKIPPEVFARFPEEVKDRLDQNYRVNALIHKIEGGWSGNIEPKSMFSLLPNKFKIMLKENQARNKKKGFGGRGISGWGTHSVMADEREVVDRGDSAEGGGSDREDSSSDEETRGGSLLGKIGDVVYKTYVKPKLQLAHAITHPVETFNKAKQMGHDIIHGRMDYSPSVKEILEKYGNEDVIDIDLHRLVLSVVYTGLLNVLTWGEFNKRVKEQPKDKLFHISMWVKLKSGTTILVEKNEVISMKVNPTKPKEQEQQPVDIKPAKGLMFAEMLERAREKYGDKKFFSYSAKDNNCGNFIEMVLEANGMASKATNDFIGQDAKAILKGFPKIRKFMNTLTDVAGRANVVLEGGDIEGKGFGTKIARKIYDWWKPPMSFEEWREREKSRFKSDAEAEHALAQAQADRRIIEEERKLAKLKADTEAHRRKLHEIREMKLRLADEIGVWLGDDDNYVNWDEAREHFARIEETDRKIEAEDPDWDNTTGYGLEKIDWEDIKWGSFTKQFEEYKRQHPNSKIDDLEHFAESILANPEDYRKTTLKRARFYLNVLMKKKLSHHNNIMPTQGGRMIGLSRPAVLPAHIGHPALMSDQHPRIPQAFTQIHLTHPIPMGGHGLYAGGGLGGDLLDDIYGGARHTLGVGLGGKINIGRAFSKAFDPKKNGVAKAFQPVENFAKKTFTPQLGRDITSGLIHQALPAVISGVAGSATSALTGNPALGFAVGQTAGKYAGKQAGDALGKATGYGLGSGMKRPHLVKGSKEAKEYMASIRRKKMKGGDLPPRSRGIITDPSLL